MSALKHRVVVRMFGSSRYPSRRPFQPHRDLDARRLAAEECQKLARKNESTPESYPQGCTGASMKKGMDEPDLFVSGVLQQTTHGAHAAVA